MENKEILAKLQEIFIDVLDLDELVLTPETTSNDIEDWDSLTHVQLVVAIQKEFGIKFNSKDIVSWANVQDMSKHPTPILAV